MGFADWDALREEASHIPVKLTKSGKVDGRTKLGKMLKQKGLDGMPVKLTKTGSIDGRSKLGKQLAGMKTLKTKPSGAKGATPAPSPTSAGSGSGGKTPKPGKDTSGDKDDEKYTGGDIGPRQRNTWQKFSRFANMSKMFYNVATGKSGATDTINAVEKNSDSKQLTSFTSTEKSMKSADEKDFDGLFRKAQILRERISHESNPKKRDELQKELDKTMIELERIKNRLDN